MKIISIMPKDVHVTFEISLTDLLKLKKALSLSKIEYDSTVPEENEAVIYFTNGFHPAIERVLKELGIRDDA